MRILLAVLVIPLSSCQSLAFQGSFLVQRNKSAGGKCLNYFLGGSSPKRVIALRSSPSGDDNDGKPPSNKKDMDVVFVGEDDEELPEGLMDEIEASQPSQLTVMKDILGVNIFTFILAGLIAFFMGMNVLLGPGWLGSSIGGGNQGGIKGTGTFDDTPGVVDLSASRYQQ
mmetsp:Transcript_4333/g.5694  ORF Transcript_4333/g.5694 Transcript_4333/m.5694 type:complete len:170 (-) Transcript_4333:592-1101(-)|eukprot:CAMPEP_0198141032 /NCGR_PEP_ID=MMETSP1443-20131203/4102_1 /TAXON_ID=186043 /ORGANISM="Entomoneis sp., Strain CCMP2396" /LENGTH=169 /DNA_ID=CAMNT_0043803637 /DNA_START=88 /DNA_END=597 /DNA_ORIENTATION=-